MPLSGIYFEPPPREDVPPVLHDTFRAGKCPWRTRYTEKRKFGTESIFKCTARPQKVNIKTDPTQYPHCKARPQSCILRGRLEAKLRGCKSLDKFL